MKSPRKIFSEISNNTTNEGFTVEGFSAKQQNYLMNVPEGNYSGSGFEGDVSSTPNARTMISEHPVSSSIMMPQVRSRFGWQDMKPQPVEGDSSSLARTTSWPAKPQQNSSLELAMVDDGHGFVNYDNGVPIDTPNRISRSSRCTQSVSSSSGSLSGISAPDVQLSAPPPKADAKHNFSQHHFDVKEDPTFWADHNVQVVIRVRPLSGIEVQTQGLSRCIKQESAHTITWLGHPESRFTFDVVAGEKINQEKLFKVAGVPMVENCIAGFNSCMFAYGQTGSGKTHTMLGDIEDAEQSLSDNRGMTPRVFEHLFERIKKEEDVRKDEKLKYICKCSFLEIYNEQVADLLEPSSTNLQMREDAKKGVYVENLTEMEVKGVTDVIRVLLQGSANRKVAATNMNRASSRSHSVFTCVIESKWQSQAIAHHRYGRLHLVDLAGSERQKSSGAEGERLKEATNINKSLSTLGLVIMNLVNISNGKPQHVPYRDSKLTFLLQDSLGGNSKTTIIANVSPSNCCSLETLSTLKFAQRAKFIRNNAIVNEDATGDVLALKMQIQQLKEENHRLQCQVKGLDYDNGNMSVFSSPRPGIRDTNNFTKDTVDERNARIRGMEVALHSTLKRVHSLESTLEALTAEKELLDCLTKKLEEESQSRKMMVRFREEKIKRLEKLASNKLSAEEYFIGENKYLLEEIGILKGQIERNPEVTRFAMENIRLQEQLRWYESFYDENQYNIELTEQMEALHNQLFKALEMKIINGQQVDQYRIEVDKLQRDLTSCQEAKAKLERCIDELIAKFSIEKTSTLGKSANEDHETEKDLKDLVEAISVASQREAEAQGATVDLAREASDLRNKLKESVTDNERLIDLYEKVMQERDGLVKGERAMRETLEKTQEEVLYLQKQLELYENGKAGRNSTSLVSDDFYGNDGLTDNMPYGSTQVAFHTESGAVEYSHQISELELKFHDTSEENERLLELYEEAMRDRDDARRKLNDCQSRTAVAEHVIYTQSTYEETEENKNKGQASFLGELKVPHSGLETEELQMKLNEIVEENEKLVEMYEKAMQEKDNYRKLLEDSMQCEVLQQKEIANSDLGFQESPMSEELAARREEDSYKETINKIKEDIQARKEQINESLTGTFKMDHTEHENLEPYKLSSPLRKDLEELNFKLKAKEEEYDNLAVLYQETFRVKDRSRDALEQLESVQEMKIQDQVELYNVGNSMQNLSRETEKKVQKIFEIMDTTVGKFSVTTKSLEMFRRKLETGIDITQDEVIDFVSSISTKFQDVQLELESLEVQLQLYDPNRKCSTHPSSVQTHESIEIDSWPPSQGITLVRSKLVLVQQKISELEGLIDSLSLIENSHKELESLRQQISLKQSEIEMLQTLADELQIKKHRVYDMLSAVKGVVCNFLESDDYRKKLETNKMLKLKSSAYMLSEKMDQMAHLQAEKNAADSAIHEITEMQVAMEAEVHDIKEQLHVAVQHRLDVEKAVKNVEGADLYSDLRSSSEQISMNFGKAALLLRGEEEKGKLSNALKRSYDLLQNYKENKSKLEGKIKEIDSSINRLQLEIEASSSAIREIEASFQQTSNEDQMLDCLQATEGKGKMDDIILELQTIELEVQSKEEELMSNKEELKQLIDRLSKLEISFDMAESIKLQLESESCTLSQLVLNKLKNVMAFISEAISSLDTFPARKNSSHE